MLVRAGHRLVIIDRRGILLGSTPTSIALLQFEPNTPLIYLKRRIGAARAVRAWRRSYSAVGALADLFRKEKLDAGARTRPSVNLAGNVLDATGL